MDKIIVILVIYKRNIKLDIEIPVNITANEFILSLDQAFSLGIDKDNIVECYLKTENPISFLKGDKLLKDFNLRNGTVINVL